MKKLISKKRSEGSWPNPNSARTQSSGAYPMRSRFIPLDPEVA